MYQPCAGVPPIVPDAADVSSLVTSDDRVRGLGRRRDEERCEGGGCQGRDDAAHVSHGMRGSGLVHDPNGQSERSAGKSTTSRIDSVPVSSITSRSMPSPIPLVGGIP